MYAVAPVTGLQDSVISASPVAVAVTSAGAATTAADVVAATALKASFRILRRSLPTASR
jgi:hypothetical protein